MDRNRNRGSGCMVKGTKFFRYVQRKRKRQGGAPTGYRMKHTQTTGGSVLQQTGRSDAMMMTIQKQLRIR